MRETSIDFCVVPGYQYDFAVPQIRDCRVSFDRGAFSHEFDIDVCRGVRLCVGRASQPLLLVHAYGRIPRAVIAQEEGHCYGSPVPLVDLQCP